MGPLTLSECGFYPLSFRIQISHLVATISRPCRKHLAAGACSTSVWFRAKRHFCHQRHSAPLAKTQGHSIEAPAVTNSQQSFFFFFFSVRNETTVEVEGLSDESGECSCGKGGRDRDPA